MAAGQPAKYKSAEELEDKIKEYFDSLEKETDITITGLVLYLGFCDRSSFYDYEKREEFSYTIKKARSRIENSYEKIALYEVGPTKIIGHHSKVEVHGAQGYLDIKDNYSKVEANNIRGNFLVEGKNLGVLGKTIIGQEISITSSYRNVNLSEFSGKTTISLSHGDIVLEPSPLTHPIEVKGKYSSIRFSWPLQGRYPFEAWAKNGDIKWGLPDELSLEEENGISIIKAFLQEKDKPSILLSTSYGTIRIED